MNVETGGVEGVRSRLRESVIAPAMAIVMTLAVFTAIGGLLVLLEPRSPSPAGPDTGLLAAPPGPTTVPPGRYGSGTLGPWQNLLRRITPDDQIRDVLTFNGIFMFGDSIAVQDGPALEQLLATGPVTRSPSTTGPVSRRPRRSTRWRAGRATTACPAGS